MQSQSASAQTALSVTALSKQFGRGETAIQAVDDVSFEINSGEIVGLLGPNGAGKTTLIKSILGTIILMKEVSIFTVTQLQMPPDRHMPTLMSCLRVHETIIGD
jgi:ABC-type multidrug transport system, ATPase component